MTLNNGEQSNITSNEDKVEWFKGRVETAGNKVIFPVSTAARKIVSIQLELSTGERECHPSVVCESGQHIRIGRNEYFRSIKDTTISTEEARIFVDGTGQYAWILFTSKHVKAFTCSLIKEEEEEEVSGFQQGSHCIYAHDDLPGNGFDFALKLPEKTYEFKAHVKYQNDESEDSADITGTTLLQGDKENMPPSTGTSNQKRFGTSNQKSSAKANSSYM